MFVIFCGIGCGGGLSSYGDEAGRLSSGFIAAIIPNYCCVLPFWSWMMMAWYASIPVPPLFLRRALCSLGASSKQKRLELLTA